MLTQHFSPYKQVS